MQNALFLFYPAASPPTSALSRAAAALALVSASTSATISLIEHSSDAHIARRAFHASLSRSPSSK